MNISSHELRGKKYFLEGNLTVSITTLTEALSQEPGSLSVRLVRGAAHLKLGQIDEALNDLTAVLEGEGDCEKAFFLRGIAYLNKSEFAKAVIDLNKTLEYNEKRGPAILARGIALSNLGQLEEARKDIQSPYVKANVVIDEFIEEYAISEASFNQVLALLNDETNLWNLVLTKDEMTKMETSSLLVERGIQSDLPH